MKLKKTLWISYISVKVGKVALCHLEGSKPLVFVATRDVPNLATYLNLVYRSTTEQHNIHTSGKSFKI